MRDTIPASLLDQARWQAGLVTRTQALRAGLSSNAITSKVVHARWQQVHRGVYATFSGSVVPEARLWAAVLYAGPGARLSHESAAELIRLTNRRSPLIHVTIPPNRRVKPPPGVTIHLSSNGCTGWRFAHGVPPHTFAEETVIDLVHAADDLNDVIAWVTAAFGRKLTNADRLRQEAAARASSAGGPISRRSSWPERAGRTQSSNTGMTVTSSRRTGSPAAAKQARFTKPDGSAGYRDRYYEEYGLIVELDGKQYHPDEHKGRDQDRDNHAAATSGSTLRYGWIDVTRKQCAAAAQVHAALTTRGYTGPLKPCSPTCSALQTPRL